MAKGNILWIGVIAFVVGLGLGNFGWIGFVPVACLAVLVGLVFIAAKSMGMPYKDAPSVVAFFGGLALVTAAGWFVAASEELGLVPASNN